MLALLSAILAITKVELNAKKSTHIYFNPASESIRMKLISMLNVAIFHTCMAKPLGMSEGRSTFLTCRLLQSAEVRPDLTSLWPLVHTGKNKHTHAGLCASEG